MCVVHLREGKNLCYVRLQFFIRSKRRASIDTGTFDNASRESRVFNDPNLNLLEKTLEKHYKNSVKMSSSQGVPIKNKKTFQFRLNLAFSKIVF